MSDTLLAILHMCIFPGGAFALAVGFFFKLDRRVEAPPAPAWATLIPALAGHPLNALKTLIPKTACRSRPFC